MPDNAETHQNLGYALLNLGQLEEGLNELDWRWSTDKRSISKREFSQPLWDRNKSLKGKTILLWSEQGVGDTITWSSRLSLIASQAEHCILECQEKLVPLLTRSFPNLEIKTENRNSDTIRKDFDFHMPLGNIYQQFLPEISKKNRVDAFLVPDPARIKFWRERLKSIGTGPYIGISWKSANITTRRYQNYAPISAFSPLLTLGTGTFVNLQYVDFADDLSKVQNDLGVTIHNFDDLDHFNDLDDVAALCAALDIVVSTRVTPPFIAAGVGTYTIIANWRQSSWNSILNNPAGPSVHMFDRNTWEPWDNTIASISKEILKKTKKTK